MTWARLGAVLGLAVGLIGAGTAQGSPRPLDVRCPCLVVSARTTATVDVTFERAVSFVAGFSTAGRQSGIIGYFLQRPEGGQPLVGTIMVPTARPMTGFFRLGSQEATTRVAAGRYRLTVVTQRPVTITINTAGGLRGTRQLVARRQVPMATSQVPVDLGTATIDAPLAHANRAVLLAATLQYVEGHGRVNYVNACALDGRYAGVPPPFACEASGERGSYVSGSPQETASPQALGRVYTKSDARQYSRVQHTAAATGSGARYAVGVAVAVGY